MSRTLGNQRGITLVEMLIAAVLSGLIAAAALQFYLNQHKIWLIQNDVADTQQNARACLDEIAGSIRMAGYGLPFGHERFHASGDSISLYFQRAGAIDTVMYYVDSITGSPPLLYRKLNKEDPEVFAERIERISIVRLTPYVLELAVVARGAQRDDNMYDETGFRSRRHSVQIRLRNAWL